MADHAGLVLNGIVAMCGFECLFAAVMTGQAERRLGLDQEILLIRTMGIMARPAPLCLQDLVNYLLFKKLLLVAAIADILDISVEQMGRRRGMRIVAGYTFAAFQCGVNIFFVHSHFFLRVALVAEIVSRLLQDEFGHDAVSQMAILALLLLHDLMHVFHPEILVRKFRMTVEALLAGEFLSCR